MLLKYLTLLAVWCGCLECSTKPGFRFQVTQKGVNYGRDVLVPILTKVIKTAQIPTITQVVDAPVIGHITFTLSRVRIGTVDISHSDVGLKPPSDVSARIYKAGINLHANWAYRQHGWPHISDSGSLDMGASGITIQVEIRVDTTNKGQPHITTKSCGFHIGYLSVEFHGGASWLYNLFSNNIAGAIKGAISGQVCPLITKEINTDLNGILATVDLKTPLDDKCYIDYSLVQPPFVKQNVLFVNGKGEIFYKKHPTECPSEKQELPETIFNNRMVTLWVTEYMLNTAGYAYQVADFLQLNVTSSDIPPQVPIKFNTDFFKYFIPNLYEQYPDKNLELWLYVTKPITFDINTAGVSGRAEGTITWFVDNSTDNSRSELIEVFKLNGQLDLCVNMSVHLGAKSEIYLDIITVEPYIQLNSSKIGNFSIEPLSNFLKLSRSLIIPFVNGLIKNGIPLPSFQDIVFNGFDFTLHDGYVAIHTDVKYDPSGVHASQVEQHTIFVDDFVCQIRDPLAEMVGKVGKYLLDL